MPLFKVGDHVERVGSIVPEYMKFGRILCVSPRPPELPDYLTEYEVDFKFIVATFYQTQLRLVATDEDSSQSLLPFVTIGDVRPCLTALDHPGSILRVRQSATFRYPGRRSMRGNDHGEDSGAFAGLKLAREPRQEPFPPVVTRGQFPSNIQHLT